jgi:hypothetical protein
LIALLKAGRLTQVAADKIQRLLGIEVPADSTLLDIFLGTYGRLVSRVRYPASEKLIAFQELEGFGLIDQEKYRSADGIPAGMVISLVMIAKITETGRRFRNRLLVASRIELDQIAG